jgi:hypothetical protein
VSRIVPYGFRLADDAKMIELDAAEQGTRHVIRELRDAGRSLRDVGGGVER